MGQRVDYSATSGVAQISLHDPPDNSFTHEMMKELDEAIIEARFDNDIHTLLLIGAGDRFFSNGASMEMLREVDASFQSNFFLHANETLIRLENTPKLVIAAINGHCTGGGLALALACDLRIARAGALRIGLPEVNAGLLPGLGSTQRLTHLLGKAKAMELLIEGETFDVNQALSLGILHKIFDVSATEFLPHVFEWALRFGPPSKAPLTVGRIKRAVQSATESGLPQGIALEGELQSILASTEDAQEGLHASRSRRPPAFNGR